LAHFYGDLAYFLFALADFPTSLAHFRSLLADFPFKGIFQTKSAIAT